jgi:hypothetical protein
MTFGPRTNIYTSSAPETLAEVTGLVPFTKGGALLGLIADSSDGYAAWVQVFDGYAAAVNGAVPLVSLRVAANAQISLDGKAFAGVPVSNGICIGLSSTGPTYTAVSNSLFVTAFWLGR